MAKEKENKHEEVSIDGEVFHIKDDDRLNKILQDLEMSMGNTKPYQKLTSFYFQGLKKDEDKTVDEIMEDSHVFLICALINPSNPNTLIGAIPIAFKRELFKLTQKDYNAITNNVEEIFKQKFEALEEEAKDGKSKNKSK